MAGSTNWPSSLDSHTGGNPFGFAEVGNLIYTRLTAAATAAATTLTVASTTGFASRGIVIVGLETITYTGKTSTTFTGCTRGTGGTTAAAYGVGAIVGSAPVAANLNDHSAAIVAIETQLGAGYGASNSVPRKLGEVNGTGASGVLEFSSIPSTYRHLMLIVSGRSDTAATSAGIRLTFETSPTAGAYLQELLQVFGSSTSVTEQLSGVVDFISAGIASGASSPANLYGTAVVHISNYASTSQYKTAVSTGFSPIDTTTGNLFFRLNGGLWTSTAAVDRIRLTLAAGNWTTASRATLYGLPA